MTSVDTGYIYLMTNPSMPDWVKIGYSEDVDERLRELNSYPATPLAFRVYAKYPVPKPLADKDLLKFIDILNPDLRSRDEIDGRTRTREFVSLSAEDAFEVLRCMAAIHGREDMLERCEMSVDEKKDEVVARKARRPNFSFARCNIPPGSVLEFWPDKKTNSGITCIVVGDSSVDLNGTTYSLSGLAQKLKGKPSLDGPLYFKYNGRWLTDIRDDIEREMESSESDSSDS